MSPSSQAHNCWLIISLNTVKPTEISLISFGRYQILPRWIPKSFLSSYWVRMLAGVLHWVLYVQKLLTDCISDIFYLECMHSSIDHNHRSDCVMFELQIPSQIDLQIIGRLLPIHTVAECCTSSLYCSLFTSRGSRVRKSFSGLRSVVYGPQMTDSSTFVNIYSKQSSLGKLFEKSMKSPGWPLMTRL